MIYFISGHRDISQEEFNKYYKPQLDKAIEDKNKKFVVGDYYGVDIMTQEYLVSKGLEDYITVYHMFDKPRNIASDKISTKGGYTTDDERDSAMTKDSNIDIAFIRKGKEKSGTALNILRRYTFV